MEARFICRTYWGTHGCELPRGHIGTHWCDCCDCIKHPEPDSGCVGQSPYYGPMTAFYGEDANKPRCANHLRGEPYMARCERPEGHPGDHRIEVEWNDKWGVYLNDATTNSL